MIQDAAGNLYGTTALGNTTSKGGGTVFKLETMGKETVLYRFAGGADGCEPFAGLVRDKAGDFYGTTIGCGASGYGTVFKLDTTGKETVLHTFAGYPADGADPYARLVLVRAGNLYGTTYFGGDGGGCLNNNQNIGCGTIFKVDTTGSEIELHNFSADVDGAEITAGSVLKAISMAPPP